MTAVEWLEEKLDDALSDTDYLTWKLVCEDIKQAKEMEKKDIENNAIHFAEWLTKKHTTTLMLLYEQFKQEEQ